MNIMFISAGILVDKKQRMITRQTAIDMETYNLTADEKKIAKHDFYHDYR